MLSLVVAGQSILLLIIVIVLLRVRADLKRNRTLSRMAFDALVEDLSSRGRIMNLNAAREP